MSAFIVKPVLPGLMKDFFSSDNTTVTSGDCHNDGYSEAASVKSTVDALSATVAFTSSAFIGGLSDSIGRKPVLCFCTMCLVLPPLCLMLSSNLWWYFGALVVQGLGGVGGWLNPLVVACVADQGIKGDERTRDVAWLYSAVALTLVLSPLTTALVSHYFTNFEVFVVATSLPLLATVYIFFIPETLPPSKRVPLSCRATINPCTVVRLLQKRRLLRGLCVVYFLSTLPETGVVEVAFLYCDDVMGLKGAEATNFNSSLYLVAGVVMLLSTTLGFRSMLRLMGDKYLMIFGFLLNGVHMAGYALTAVWPYKATMYVTEIIIALSTVGNASLQSLASGSLSAAEHGIGMGILSSVSGLNAAVGPLVFGWMYSTFRCPPLNFPEAPFFLGVILAFLAAFLTAVWIPRLIAKEPLLRQDKVLTSSADASEEETLKSPLSPDS